MNINKRKLPITLSIASLIISAVCASADTLYWVDAATYFNAASGNIEGTGIIWNIDRDFSSAEKSKYSDAYNWATGYTIKEVKVPSDSGETTYYVPEYTYASSVTAPNENTDVYFKFTGFSEGSSSVGYRHQIAGSPSLSSDITIKSLTIENANDNWLMFKTNGHDITIKEDLTYSSGTVAYIGSDPKTTDIYVGGYVNMHGTSTSMWNALRIGNNGVNSIKIGKDIVFKGNPGRVQLATAGAATTFADPQSVVSGIVDFSGFASRLDLGRYGKNNGVEQFYAFGGLSGTNFEAKVSTGAEVDANGLNSTLVLKNSADAEFAGMVTNPVTAEDSDDKVKPAITTTMNVVMNGSAKQVLSGDNSFNGYIQVESGTLILRTASEASHGKLTINGGKIGAIKNMTVSSAEWNGGAISFINSDDAIANVEPETITIEGDFLKSEGKIMMDFNNFDTTDFVDEDIWFDLIFVDGKTTNFSDDANDDFYATNLDTYADFQWIAGKDGHNKVLQVSFTSVPEPAELAVLIGAIALSMAVFRRRR